MQYVAGPLLNPAKGVSYFECTKHGSFIVRKEQWEYAVNGFKALGELAQNLASVSHLKLI